MSYIRVPHTCPSIDKVQKILRECMSELESAASLLEELRSQNEQLRHNADYWEEEYNQLKDEQ